MTEENSIEQQGAAGVKGDGMTNDAKASGEWDAIPDNPANGSRVKNPAAILFVAAFAAFLATFNETFLNVGFAPIMADLAVDVSTVQWLATAYMLGAAVMVPVSAFAYRSFPTRSLFCTTVLFLVAGSVVGAVAQVLAESHVKKAPVVDGGKMVGIINRSNITRYCIERYFN